MNRLLLSLLLAFLTGISLSQTNGNEWINYTQSYYKFEIYQTGIHKIDYNALNNAGVPLSTFSTKNIQLFGREKEIPIYIVDGGDQSFDNGDYLIFFAEKNDGWIDSLVYKNPAGIGNPSYSLYNDTINYFFTWNDQTNNLRFQLESDNNFNSISVPAPYWLKKVEQSYNNFYVECRDNNGYSSSSFFIDGEGWSSNHVNGINGYTFSINAPTPSPFTGIGAPPVQFQGISVSNSNAYNTVVTNGPNHDFTWKVGASNYVIHTEQFKGYAQKNINATFPVGILGTNTTPLKWIINPSTQYATDFQALSYWSLIYPKQTTMSGQNSDRFWIKNNNSATKIRLDITNSTLVNPIMFVFGSTIPKLVTLSNNGSGVWQTLITNSTNGVNQEVVISDESNIINVTIIEPVSISSKFKNFSVYANDTNVLLMVYHPSLQMGTAQYASYRSSADGGSYNVVLADINELYLQYGGGIEKHVLGIRRFVKHVYENAQFQKPKALFLVGKGIREANESFNGITPGTRKSVAAFHNSLIPSFGYPSSDISITSNMIAGSDTTHWDPLIPTGRVAVKTNQELLEYLDKVKQFESNQDPQSNYTSANKAWQKQVLHFAGGSSLSDQTEFQYYLNTMKPIIEDTLFGGEVSTFQKTSSDPLDPIVINEITERVSDGVSIMNFFGHASVDGFEISLDDPTNWNNAGKYPLVIGNACYTGDIYQNYSSASENFVLVPSSGAIAFLSTVRTGVGFSLNQYTRELYRQFSVESYGDYLSSQMKKVIRKTHQLYPSSIYMETTCNQMGLHGDPLIRINWHEKPEIEITDQSLFFQPSEIDLTVDSIEVNVVLTNLGRSVADTFQLEVTRTFPNNTDSLYTLQIPGLDFKDTIRFKIPLQPNIGVGINYFTVRVDLPSQIAEFEDVTNNQIIKKPLIIKVDGIIPVIPYEFAVVPIDSVTLKASTINPIADFNTYRFEIDTTDLFNSPEHRFAMVSGLGGVKEVNPSQWKKVGNNQSFPLVCTDSTVYFWRVAVDSTVLNWKESSFQYISGKKGWGQDHFFQFKKNGFNNVIYDRDNRLREFDTVPRVLSVDVYDNASNSAQRSGTLFRLDNQMIEYAMCQTIPSLHVAVFDPVTLEAWGTRYNGQNPTHNFGNANDNGACRQRVEKYFIFRQQTPGQLEAFRNMITNSIPDGHYVLIYTTIRAEYQYWDDVTPSLSSTFADLGATNIGQGPNKAFIFFYKKGDPTSVQEVVATQPDNMTELISLEVEIDGFNYLGAEKSTVIGPAQKWETIYWKQDALEAPFNDTTRLKIQGLDWSRNVLTTIDTVFTHKDSILQLNSILPAASYPYLQLSASYKDKNTYTPAQIDRWHVLYQPLPEAAIDGTNAYYLSPVDTLTEGQSAQFAVDIKNIYDIDMDSLLVNYWITDANNVRHEINYPRQDSLRVGEVIRDTITINTVGLGGINSLWVEVNPYVDGNSMITDQPEQQHFNNLLQLPFYVKDDNINPILDVTFNGQRILNGDIIAPESEILISLKDENPFMVMNDISDTTLFGVYLTGPDGIQKRIPFIDGQGNTILEWIPAESNHKRFKIIYNSKFEQDGKYTLFVQGSDRSGNLSGDLEYKITFEVINESSITHMMNYPNPFSTSTRFVFTLTGNEVPEDILIQIVSVTGKVVREITEEQLGPIQIGRNITTYAWDGKDEFGDQLANGVYLYTVKARINGEEIKHRESGADQYFKKSFGKMYLLR